MGDHSNINISDWRKLENPDNSEFEKFERTESFSLSLSGVPFVDHSDVTKTLTYYIDKNGTYHINGISKSVGIPFADSFTISTKIEFHPCMNNTGTCPKPDGTILRLSLFVLFRFSVTNI